MAFDDNTPENGDESSNRTFIIAAAGLGGVFILGLVVLLVVLGSRQGAREQIENGNGTAAALAAEQTQLAQVTDTLAPTDTEAPTETPTPSATVALPTQTDTLEPTQLSADVSPDASSAAQTTTTVASGATSAASPATTGTRAAATTARPAGTTARTTATGGATTGNDLPSTGVGDVAGLMFAGFLVLLIVVARRMRVSQS